MFEHKKTLGISYALHALKAGTHFYSRPNHIMRSFILWQWKKISFAINFGSYSMGLFRTFWNEF